MTLQWRCAGSYVTHETKVRQLSGVSTVCHVAVSVLFIKCTCAITDETYICLLCSTSCISI